MTIPLTPCVHGRKFCIWCHANQTDQALPLTATEHAELEQLRRNARLHQHIEQQQQRALLHAQAMQNAYPFGLGQNIQLNAEEQRLRNYRNNALLEVAALTPPSPITVQASGVYVVPEDAKIHGGRKLRDALLMAGHNTYEQNKAKSEIVCNDLAVKVLAEMHGRAPRPEVDQGVHDALLMAGIADADAGRIKPLSEVKARYSRKMRRSLPKLVGYLAFVTTCGMGAVLALLVLGMIVKVLP